MRLLGITEAELRLPGSANGFALPRLLTAREFMALPESKASDLLLGPLVVRGARTILVGDNGHGKTTLALQMLGGILDGRDVIGYEGAGSGPVLIVDLEQGQRSIKRGLRESRLADRDDVLMWSVPDGLALDTDPTHLARLQEFVEEHKPVIVLLDPYYKAHRGDANEERAVVDLMRALDGLRASYGFALLLPAHPRKDQSGRDGHRKLTIHDVSGSGAVTRGAEVVLAIERLSHGYARLRILKDRDGDLEVGEEWPLVFGREHGFSLDPKEQVEEEQLEQRILVNVGAGALLTAKEWAANLGTRESRAKQILDALVAADRIAHIVGPPGRKHNANCYGAAPALWAQQGVAEASGADSAAAPDAPAAYREQQEREQQHSSKLAAPAAGSAADPRKT